jgi:hypothetical protein
MKIVVWSFVICMSLGGVMRAEAYNVVLGWNISPSIAATGYNVYYGTNSGQYPFKVNVGNLSSVTISNLSAGVAYYVNATAYDASGNESPLSGEISVVTPGALTLGQSPVPGQPPSLQFTAMMGHWYEIQATTNFQNWSSIWQSGVASSNTWMQCVDPNAGGFNLRFYRLEQH